MADEDSTRAAYQKAWREANKEKRKAYAADYYAANQEKLRASMAQRYEQKPDSYKRNAREWKEKNPERFKEIRAGAYARNVEKVREKSRADWQKNNAKRKATKVRYRALNPDLGAHHCRLRQTRKQQATPAWADLTAIKAKYAEAARLRKQTGEKWHVDHEVPLKHPLVCGLHVEFNLRVIPAGENQSKGNAFEVWK